MVSMPTLRRQARAIGADERGFTLVELLVASAVSVILLGGAVMLTSQIQNGYRQQMEEASAMQEARYALDWIGRLIRGAGNNPYMSAGCPDPEGAFTFDPGGNGIDDDIRIRSDNNPTDGVCDQANEDVTIRFDAANNTIVFVDNNLGGEATVRTDQVIDDLRFTYFNPTRGEPSGTADVAYVEVRLTVRNRTRGLFATGPDAPVLTQEFRVRTR